MKPVSKRVKDLRSSGIRKYFDLASMEEGIVSLGVGEPDFATPYRIRDMGLRAIELNYTHYTANSGLLELRESVSKKLEKENGIQAPPENILITSGSSEGLDLVMRALLDAGDEILVPEPCYVAYQPLASLAGGMPVMVPTYENDEFRISMDELEGKVTKKTKALIICSPNNPTGAVLPKKDLEGISDFAIKNDLFVISDEIYEKIIYGERHYSIASLPEMAERTITLNGFSKAYAATGWRVGYLTAPSGIIGGLHKIHQYNTLCAPAPSQYAMLRAFEEEESVSAMVKEYDRRRKLLVRGLDELPGISCPLPKGAFYAFPNITGTKMGSGEFAEFMIKNAKVALVPGHVFGESGEGHVRCSYSVSAEDISEALGRMKKVLR
ncbi:MAG: pyridoxal phosphate-dependent aminotransferase [Candidatus Altiarchaeota archaeon]|nr:pyridoxal phosphate-dependent aminotransferase [Candidatus Altiarchaeota archaeon]